MSRKLHLLETKMCSQGPQVGHPRSEAEVTQRYSVRFAPLNAVPRDNRILLAGLGYLDIARSQPDDCRRITLAFRPGISGRYEPFTP